MKQELVNNPPLARLQRFFGAIGGMAPHKQVALMATLNHRHVIRRHVAGKRLAGRGIEIGAQFLPTIAPDHPHARVKYLDRLSSEELSRRYGMPLESLVPVSHIADASNLSLFRDSELDFLIAAPAEPAASSDFWRMAGWKEGPERPPLSAGRRKLHQMNSKHCIEPFSCDKVLILPLNNTKFHAISLQRRIERATAYRSGSRGRSIITAFGGSPP